MALATALRCYACRELHDDIGPEARDDEGRPRCPECNTTNVTTWSYPRGGA